MNIKRIPVIISDMRENMLFSKKMGLHSMPTFRKISELSFAFNLLLLFDFAIQCSSLAVLSSSFRHICRQYSFNCN